MFYEKVLSLLFILNVFLCCENRFNKQVLNDLVDNKSNNKNKIELINDTNSLVLSEYVILNESFKQLLNSILDEYLECENFKIGYYFTITIQNATIHESSDDKSVYMSLETENIEKTKLAISLYISRSYYKDYVSNGYGFFYYNDYLFVLQGIKLENLFLQSNRKKNFKYKYEPPLIFDPPRWNICIWNNKFYLISKSPCGG